jgi:hypothetical protein
LDVELGSLAITPTTALAKKVRAHNATIQMAKQCVPRGARKTANVKKDMYVQAMQFA